MSKQERQVSKSNMKEIMYLCNDWNNTKHWLLDLYSHSNHQVTDKKELHDDCCGYPRDSFAYSLFADFDNPFATDPVIGFVLQNFVVVAELLWTAGIFSKIIDQVDAMDFVPKSSKSELSLRFFGRLKISKVSKAGTPKVKCQFGGTVNFWASPLNSCRKTIPNPLKFSCIRRLARVNVSTKDFQTWILAKTDFHKSCGLVPSDEETGIWEDRLRETRLGGHDLGAVVYILGARKWLGLNPFNGVLWITYFFVVPKKQRQRPGIGAGGSKLVTGYNFNKSYLRNTVISLLDHSWSLAKRLDREIRVKWRGFWRALATNGASS